MQFASEYVLDQDAEYEQVSDDEFHKGMSVSDSDSDSEEAPAQRSRFARLSLGRVLGQSKKKKQKKPQKRSHWKSSSNAAPASKSMSDREVQEGMNKRWFRRADTNIVSVKFDTLLSPMDMHAGEPVICAQCGAILSHISKLKSQGSDKVWSCEFCGTTATVDIEEEEKPTTEDVTFLLEPAASTASSTMSGMDESMVIFVVDTSGSMCVTTAVEGKIKLRGTEHLDSLQAFNTLNEDQYLPSQRSRNVTYVSRLQAMQAAVNHQLEEMAKNHGNRRVGLLSFDSEVTVIGDGSQPEVTIAGDKLTNAEELKKEGEALTLTQSIRQSSKVLGDKIYKLEEGGATALGPALVVAVSMASHHPGSKVILCTDGKANIGLGKLEEAQEETSAMEFYGDMAQTALAAGVTVSVITISGTDCKLVHLGQLADKTGGQVNIVDPLKLTEEFSNILSDPVIATKVKATFILHKDLYIVDEVDNDKEECRVEQEVGNAYASSTITFQFAPKRKRSSTSQTGKSEEEVPGASSVDDSSQGAAASSSSAPDGPSLHQRSDLPFQLQIEYTDTEGNKALRVLTRTKPITKDRRVAEQEANLDILGVHAAKTSAVLALEGQYSKSRGFALMQQRLAWRNCNTDMDAGKEERKMKYKSIFGKIKSMENRLGQQQQTEILTRGRTCSDSEGSDDEDRCEESMDYLPPQPAPEFKTVPYHAECERRSLSFSSQERQCSTKPKPKASSSKKMLISMSRKSKVDDDTAKMLYEFRHSKGALSSPKAQSDDSDDAASSSKGKGAK